MAHLEQQQYIEGLKNRFPHVFKGKKVLEVGSLNINGTVRSFFEDCDYTGIDVGEGPCVDIVCQGQEYNAPDATFDTIISCECLEHNPYWLETFVNMIRMCKPGGVVIMTCAGTGRAEHGTFRTSPECSPLTVGIGWEYYKNLTEADFRARIDMDKVFSVYEWSEHIHHGEPNPEAKDLCFWGVRK